MDSKSAFDQKVAGKKKAHNKVFGRLSQMKGGEVDGLLHEAHEKAFEKIDCLDCAQCCTHTGPLLTDDDIGRLANYEKLKPTEYIKRYLKVDEDGDHVLQALPCRYLGADNYCSIYEIRPKACREYPHTDRRNQKQILKITRRNAKCCPAVFEMVELIEVHLG